MLFSQINKQFGSLQNVREPSDLAWGELPLVLRGLRWLDRVAAESQGMSGICWEWPRWARWARGQDSVKGSSRGKIGPRLRLKQLLDTE